MLYKEITCPVCNGHGFISDSSDCAVWATPCANCRGGAVVVPMTNADLIRKCSNEQLLKVFINLATNALYSGGPNNRLLLPTPEDPADFDLWLNKNVDDTDLKTIFDFVNPDDFEHPWTRVETMVNF